MIGDPTTSTPMTFSRVTNGSHLDMVGDHDAGFVEGLLDQREALVRRHRGTVVHRNAEWITVDGAAPTYVGWIVWGQQS